MTLFILRDASGNYLTRGLTWTTDCAVTEVFQTPYKDIALNQLLELNAADVTLRASVVACQADGKNRPIIIGHQSAA